MQDYYERNVFGDKVANAPLQLSFVGTFCLIFSNCMGPFSQILGSMWGTRAVLLIGTCLIAIGMIMAGFSTQVCNARKVADKKNTASAHRCPIQIWHLYLTQGVCFGIGLSFTYVVSILLSEPTAALANKAHIDSHGSCPPIL